MQEETAWSPLCYKPAVVGDASEQEIVCLVKHSSNKNEHCEKCRFAKGYVSIPRGVHVQLNDDMEVNVAHPPLWIVWELDMVTSKKDYNDICRMRAICTSKDIAQEYVERFKREGLPSLDEWIASPQDTPTPLYFSMVERVICNHEWGRGCLHKLYTTKQKAAYIKSLEDAAERKDE